MPEQLNKAAKKGPRTSVSAEAFGEWNKKSDFKPKVVEKTDETKQKIRERLTGAFMFSALSDQEFKIVVDAMEEKKVKA